MSFKSIDAIEFECDGSCGAKTQVSVLQADRLHPPLPAGWAELRMSGEAAKAIGRQVHNCNLQLCPACFALITLPLWNPDRVVALCAGLTDDELDEYGIEEVYAKARQFQRQREQAVKS